MARIQTTIDQNGDTTLLVITGTVTSEDVIDGMRNFYGNICTSKLIWDFSRSDLQNAKSEQLAAVLAAAKSYAHLRSGGRTALVVPQDLGFGLARMYDSMAMLQNHPVAHGVFRNRDEAVAWLNAQPETD